MSDLTKKSEVLHKFTFGKKIKKSEADEPTKSTTNTEPKFGQSLVTPKKVTLPGNPFERKTVTFHGQIEMEKDPLQIVEPRQ